MLRFIQPYLVYVAGAAVMAAAFGGWTVRDWQCKAAEAATLKRVAEEKDRMQGVMDEQAVAYEEAKAAAAVVSVQRTHTIREVFRDVPVDTSCTPPAAVDGLLLDAVEDANRAVSGTPR
jgi:hypothetical protein